MERIMIIGGNGSGKTTFSSQLAQILQLPLVHLDNLYWTGQWEHVSNEEFDDLLRAELEKPQWILDGNYNRTVPVRLDYCDTVIYFDFSTAACLRGVVRRIVRNYGKSRPDMGGDCPEHFDLSFLKNVCNFNKTVRKRYYEYLNHTDGVQVIILRNRRAVKRYLVRLKTQV